MTLQEFINKYSGKFVEYGGSQDALNQCVDLVNAYIDQVLGLPIILWTNAKDFPAKAGDKYDYIKNTATAVPQAGDIIIWDGAYGHIAIFISGDVNNFFSFDQNYPTGSPCKTIQHNYINPKVVGWLRAKATNIPMNTYNGIDLSNIESVKVCVDFWAKYARDGELAKLEREITECNNLVTSKDIDINKLREDIKVSEKELGRVKMAYSELAEENKKLKEQLLAGNEEVEPETPAEEPNEEEITEEEAIGFFTKLLNLLKSIFKTKSK